MKLGIFFSVCKVEVDQVQMLILSTVEVHVPAELGEEEQLTGLKCNCHENIVSDSARYSHMERCVGDKAGIKKELSVICQSGLKQIETKAKQLP